MKISRPARARNLDEKHYRLRLWPESSTADMRGAALVGNEIAEVIGKNAEQRQARNPVRSQDPEIASFVGMRLGTGDRGRHTFGGP